jgi:voltage-gated potassium channel
MNDASQTSVRERLRIIIFEADTPAGKTFDVGLLIAILLSVLAIMLESVARIRVGWGDMLRTLEWFFTLIFTAEYVIRLYCVPNPIRYARSFFGVVDLLAVLPSYVSLILPGAQSLLVIRALRLLRIFRVFKLGRFLGEANVLSTALAGSRHKVTVFLGTVLILVIILGTLMYLIEGGRSGFDSIPETVYWAVVTLTTVGYGDVIPQTWLGKFLSAVVMILGYSILAVPTGIVTAEIVEAMQQPSAITTRSCPHCLSEGHLYQSRYCRDCGELLAIEEAAQSEARTNT